MAAEQIHPVLPDASPAASPGALPGVPSAVAQAIPAGIPPIASLAWCEWQIREHSSSFYRAFKHLPRERAQAVYAIYAFCRIADDKMDVHQDRDAVLAMGADLERFAAGATPESAMWPALRWAFDTFPLEIGPFRDMLAGQLQDGDFQQPADFEGLLRYCYLVAGTVGLMLAPMLATPSSEPVRRISVELGIAMQLTNILRDVGADYRIGRIYLPSDWMAEAGVPAGSFAGSRLTPAGIDLWERLAAEAERRYAEIRRELVRFDRKARLPVLLSLLYYRAILRRCRSARYRLLDRRIFLPDWQKALLLLQAAATVLFMKREGT